ncbi:MAG: hypothetical protein MSC51_03400 [Mollicutes bacterium]|nr:hypothetical protein [Mollicutes bacterium]
MKSMEIWNIIVEQFNKHKKSKESEIQTLWEDAFSQALGFSKFLGYLDEYSNAWEQAI